MGRSTNQSAGLRTAISFDTEDFDSDGYHESVTNPTRVTIPAGLGGYYLLGATMSAQANGAGSYDLGIELNGTTPIAEAGSHLTGTQIEETTTVALYSLVAGEYAEAYAYTNSGGTFTVRGGISYSPKLWCVLLAA